MNVKENCMEMFKKHLKKKENKKKKKLFHIRMKDLGSRLSVVVRL